MVGDLDNDKISYVPNFNSVQNLRPLGSVEAYNFYNGVGRELGTFCVLSRVASQLKIIKHPLLACISLNCNVSVKCIMMMHCQTLLLKNCI